MKKYPYIGKYEDGIITLFTGFESGYVIESPYKYKMEFSNKWEESCFKNITHEYLQSTWGVVESKEHAEFIIELAELHGVSVFRDRMIDVAKFFSVTPREGLFFWDDRECIDSSRKQITIPLPPKAKEWPQVGDEVIATHSSGKPIKGNLLAITKEYAIIQCGSYEQHLYLNSWEMVKPKTKEDLLTEELQTKLCNNNYVDNFTLASDIINGMIPGLSYNSDIESAVKGVIKYLDGDE